MILKYLSFIMAILLVFAIIGTSLSYYGVINFFRHSNILSKTGEWFFYLFIPDTIGDDTVFTTRYYRFVEYGLRMVSYEAIEQYNSVEYISQKGYEFEPFCVPCLAVRTSKEKVHAFLEIEQPIWHYYAYTYLPSLLSEYKTCGYVDVPAIDIFLRKYCTIDWKAYESGSDSLRYLHFDWIRFYETYFYKDGDHYYLRSDEESYKDLIQMRIDLLLNSDLMNNVDLECLYAFEFVDLNLHVGANRVFYYKVKDKFYLPLQYLFYFHDIKFDFNDLNDDRAQVGDHFSLNLSFPVMSELCVYDYSLFYHKYNNSSYLNYGFYDYITFE